MRNWAKAILAVMAVPFASFVPTASPAGQASPADILLAQGTGDDRQIGIVDAEPEEAPGAAGQGATGTASGATPAKVPVPAVTLPPSSTAVVVESFGVFEDQPFDLCGFEPFTVEVTSTGDIFLVSRNRKVPGAAFRGFERSLPVQTPTLLWKDCAIAVDHAVVSGMTRISISLLEGTIE